MIHFSRPRPITHGMRGHVLVISLLLGQIRDAGAHGHLTWPPSSRHGGNIHHGADCGDGSCFWFSNNVEVTTQTLPSAHRTMEPEVEGGVDVWRKNPWRSPGAAPVYGSGCGVAGGHSTNVYANGGTPPAGVTLGFDGKNLPKTNLGPAKWQVGSVVEVAWAMAANHGGGYAYRLCRADGVVNEACFQSGHLEFSGSDSAILYPNGTRVAVPRVVTAAGTTPAGSQWAKDGIPTCRTCARAYDMCGAPLSPVPGLDYGSSWNKQVNCFADCAGATSSKAFGACPGGSSALQFDPGFSDQSHYDRYTGFGKNVWEWSVLDAVVVPSGLAPGEYLLSWRWDAEESSQVWQNCADVTLVSDSADATWHLATSEALGLVPKPTNAKANEFDPYADTTGDANFDCDKQVAYCAKVNYKASQFKCGKDEATTRSEICPMYEKTSGGSTVKPALAMAVSLYVAAEVLDPRWHWTFAVISGCVIAILFPPTPPFEQLMQPFLPYVPVYLRDKT